MTAQDLDGVVAIAGSCIEAPQWPRRVYEDILLASQAAPSDTRVTRSSLVACFGGTLAGFAVSSLSPVERLAELETIAVHPSFRHRGVGSALLASLMDSAGRAGTYTMRLDVRESNAAALSLYFAYGFLQVGRRRSYYAAPIEDALLLEVRLRPAAGPGIGLSPGFTGY